MSDWIKCTDRLPDKLMHSRRSVHVLVYERNYGMTFGFYDYEVQLWRGTGFISPVITHWMPLPDAPQKEKVGL